MILLLCAVTMSVTDPRTPAVSPDGSRVVVSYRGDLWEVSALGGLMRDLTPCGSFESLPCYSPDGSTLAFTSDRTGGGDVYAMPAGGGDAVRLTWHGGPDEVEGWSASGDSVYFITSREGADSWLYSVPLSGGTPVPVVRASMLDFARTPRGLAVVTGMTPWWRRHYSGSGSRDVWLLDDDGGWTGLLDSPIDERWPMWSPASNGLIFVMEDSTGSANLHLLTGDGSIRRLTGLPGDVTFPSITADGATVLFEYAGGLFRASSPGWEPVEIVLECAADLPVPPLEEGWAGPFIDSYDLTGDSGAVALCSGGEIFCGMLTADGIEDVRRLTESPGREGSPAWSPDGTMLAYTVERDGRSDLLIAGPVLAESLFTGFRPVPSRVLTVPGGTALGPCWSPDGSMLAYLDRNASIRAVELSTGRDWEVSTARDVIHISWSPDCAWLAFSTPVDGHLEDVFIVPSAGGEPVDVSRHSNDDFQPTWSSDGRRLVYASRTDGGDYSLRQLWLTREDWEAGPERRDELLDEPVETVSIELDGLQRRTETLCTVTGYYDFYGASPDCRWFAFRGYDRAGGSDLWSVDWKGGNLDRITSSGCEPYGISVSDGYTAYFIGLGGSLECIDVTGGTGRFLGWRCRTSRSLWDLQRQKFDECWRLLRDGFYDAGLHGTDWDSLRTAYCDRAAACLLNPDFNDVVNRMLGELSASHLGIYGPWEWDSSMDSGELGIIPDPAWTGEGIRIDSVIPWSPADVDPARFVPGDAILSIDGMPVGPGLNLYRALSGTAGEEVAVEVLRAGGPDTVLVEPVTRWALGGLVYEARMERNRRIADRISGGRVGYLHIPSMDEESVAGFLADLHAEGLGRDGMVVDIRGNGGGSTHDEILEMLARPSYLVSRSRGGLESLQPLGVWQEPLALLIDETCFSDAEIFPAAWKELGLGPVVGTGTFGGVIGTVDVDLVDGTGFRIPSSGWFTLEGDNLENLGVEPDIPVAEMPGDAARNVDRQLEEAVRAVLAGM